MAYCTELSIPAILQFQMVLPVLGKQGNLQNFFVQNGSNGTIGVASLADYKAFGSCARPEIVAQTFDDLCVDKQIALGLVYFHNSSLDRSQVTALLKTYYHLFLNNIQWVQTFNEHPEHFDFPSFVEHLKVKSKIDMSQ